MAVVKATRENLPILAEAIKRGEVVILPCDTFYGFVTNALVKESVQKIYDLKIREPKKPLGIFVNQEDAEKYAYVNDKAKIVMDNLLPGPLNMILKKKEIVPDFLTSNNDTVMIMCHSIWILRELYDMTKIPLASSSCNYSGEPAATNVSQVLKFKDDVSVIFDAGESNYKVNGTIIDLVGEPKILRHGAYPEDKIRKYFNI